MKTSTFFYTIAALALVAVAAVALGVPTHGVLEGTGFSTAMAVVQSVYGERIAKAFEGMIANETGFDIDTRNVETAAGISFGRACGQGTADRGTILGGTLAQFSGVSIRDITLVNPTADKYAQNQNIGLVTKGDIWVKPSVAVLVTDPVHYDATTGIFAISGGSGPIVGARWMSGGGANELCTLRLGGGLPVP